MNMPMLSLKEVANFINGKAFKPTDWSDQGIPIIRIQNLNGLDKPFNYWAGPLDKEVNVKRNDLLLAWSGTPGTSFGAHIWRGGAAVLNQHIFRVDLKENLVTKEWAKFVINAQLNTLIGMAHGGVGLQHVTKGMVEGLEIPVPPLSEQRRIAAILDQADALRAKRREALAQLDNLTQSIFIEMFGDTTTNPKKLPKLPIGNVAKISTGSTPSRTGGDYYGGVFPWVKTTEVTGKNIWSTAELLTEAGFRAIRGKLHPVDSIIVAMYGQGQTRGRSALLKVPATCNQACGVIYPTPDFLPAFMFHQIQLAYEELRALGRGGNQENLNLQLLGAFEILLPSLDLQNVFATRMQVIDALRTTHLVALSELDALFASLQHRAFRGEL